MFVTPILFAHYDATLDRDGAVIVDQSPGGRDLTLVLTTLSQAEVWNTAGIMQFGTADRAEISSNTSNTAVLDNISERIIIMSMEMDNNTGANDGDHGTAWDVSRSGETPRDGYSGFCLSNLLGFLITRVSDSGGNAADREDCPISDDLDATGGRYDKISSMIDIANGTFKTTMKNISDDVHSYTRTLTKTSTLPAQDRKFVPFGGHPTLISYPANEFKSFYLYVAYTVPVDIDDKLVWMVNNPGSLPW